jgi:hypothetical protein
MASMTLPLRSPAPASRTVSLPTGLSMTFGVGMRPAEPLGPAWPDFALNDDFVLDEDAETTDAPPPSTRIRK